MFHVVSQICVIIKLAKEKKGGSKRIRMNDIFYSKTQ